MIALAALFLPGCNNEETLVNNGGATVEKGKLSFVLPLGANRTVTYAPIQGEDAEYKMSNIRIYWFSESDGLLYKRFASGDNTFAGGADESTDGDSFTSTQGDHQTIVTISVGDFDGLSRFYIVANANGDGTTNPDMISSDPLKNVRVGVTTIDEFEKLLTDALDEGDTVRLLGTPIPMSIRDDASKTAGGYVSVDLDHENPELSPIEAQLKRRVARFDIVNTADYSNFTITSIRVVRAQKKGFLHDRPFVEAADSWSDDNTYKFTVTAPAIPDAADLAFNGPKGTGVDKNSNKIDDAFDGTVGVTQEDKEYLTKAAFYLYPTVIDNDHMKTEIVLEGLYNNSDPVLYTLDLSDAAKYPGNELAIEANKVYRIVVHRATDAQRKFELFVDEWYAEDTIAAGNKGVSITSWGTLTSSAEPNLSLDLDNTTQAQLNALWYEFSTSATRSDTLTLVTEGTNLTPNEQDVDKRHVTTIEITGEITSTMPFLQADLDSIKKSKVISTTTLTYGTRYITTHKIVLPPTMAPVNALLKVKNAINPADAKLINIRSNNYNRLGLRAVTAKWNDGTNDRYLFWAPVNVGADSLTTGAITNNTGSTVLPDTRRVVGKTYQWGRNVAFPGQGSITNITAGDTAIFAADAVGLTTFVKRNAEGDWLKPSDSGLWSGANAQGPCPDGWRIPTKEECQALLDATTRSTPAALNRLFVFNAESGGGSLYFPMIGFRGYKGEAPSGSVPGDYWTSSPHNEEGKTWGFQVYNASGSTSNVDRITLGCGRAYGFFIRAVREIPALPVAPIIP
jgi:hypothetical protein